jgi:hypothetical protein
MLIFHDVAPTGPSQWEIGQVWIVEKWEWWA